MKTLNITITLVLFLLFSLKTFHASASTFVGIVDHQLHTDLQTLVDWGHLDLSVTTYPLPWRGIKQQLDQVNILKLSPAASVAVQRLYSYLRLHQEQRQQGYLAVHTATDKHRFKDFNGPHHSKGKITLSRFVRGQKWEARLSANLDATEKAHFDESYLNYEFNHWSLRVGSISQWWGPAQSSSLILSNNARPIPAIAVSRNQATASNNRWLKYLGPWYFTAQLGQLESTRVVSNAKIWMSRFTAKPLKGLELGASWTAVWGGDGNGNSFGDFWDVVTFKAQCANGAAACDDSLYTKKGNHLAGFDLKYTISLWQRPLSFYIQRIGEDAADYYNLTDQASLFGISSYIMGAKIYLESSDTNIACGASGATVTNCFYEHGEYRSGYRRYARAIGSTFDSDAEMLSLGFLKQYYNGDKLDLSLRYVKLNVDKQKPSPVVKGNTETLLQLNGAYQTTVGKILLKLGAQIESSEVDAKAANWKASAYTRLIYQF